MDDAKLAAKTRAWAPGGQEREQVLRPLLLLLGRAPAARAVGALH